MTHPNTSFGAIRTLLRSTTAALALAAAGLCAAPPALALTVANVDVPEQLSVAGQNLVLNGAGLRQRFVFHVYVAALYRQQPTQDAETILNSAEPQMLRLTLLRDINSKALTDALNDGLKANCTEAELQDMAGTLAHFEDFMKTGGEGASGD
ncbi:MAG: chalcone isomerase family protein, partial [Castellaniella sp.]|uniref:chalcone isomerase family protein n=1 Tax=Castellaniella sp. TaxID=1955812 RepID=UPI002A365DF7